MARPGIRFDGVWKKFRRGEIHDSLRDLIPTLTRRMLGRDDRKTQIDEEEFWALKDVSFAVSQGEALGIIGRNGAGKSTVLKVLTGIMEPNRGHREVHGRAGALIEVAAGFHGDLTGRENIFLQGAVMGMPRDLIRRKMDEIVDFSGIAEFLEMPVKRYSSGMNARLGFAIAAHLEPDVLIIDEVLAVGDASFQAKAYGRIRELVESGIPVLLVSHQLDKVAELCTSVLLLDRGEVVVHGSAEECISRYLRPPGVGEEGEGASDTILSLDFPDGNRVRSGERLYLRVEARSLDDQTQGTVEPLALLVRNSRTGAIITVVGTEMCGVRLPDEPRTVDVSLQMNVPPGVYAVESLTYDLRASKMLSQGPSGVVVVEKGPEFKGGVQLNATMSLTTAGVRE